MAEYKLHCFPESGSSYRVALMLELCGADWEPVFVDYFNDATRQQSWRNDLNEMGEAPVLEHDGKKHTQSGAILFYLAKRLGKFGGRDEDQNQEILRWILFDNHKFTSYFATYRFMRSFLPTEPDEGTVAFLKGRADQCFAIVDRHLENTEFIVGNHPTIADLSMVGYTYYPLREIGYDFPQSHPNIAAWLDRIKALNGWKGPHDLMPGKRAPYREN